VQVIDRRALLGAGGAFVGAAACARLAPAVAVAHTPRRDQPRIAIIGAGLAGLSCADVLHSHGLRPHVYEARAERIGGRCWSSTGWRAGQVAEHGGEFIDTRHTAMLGLARRFGLSLDDTYDMGGGRPRLWLQGARRHQWQFADEYHVFAARIRRLARRIGSYDYRDPSPAARAVDEMTALDVVDQHLPGGAGSVAGRWVHCYLAGFLGLDLTELSGLAVVDNVANPIGGADERYHVHGGNDQIVHGLAAGLPHGAVTMDAPLSAVIRLPDDTFELRFQGHGRRQRVDVVVFCLPFTALRRVDLGRAGLSERKRRCIEELGMGTNAKVIVQFADGPQAYGDWNGVLTTDRPFFQTWQSSAGQPGRPSVITAYFGGRSGAASLPRAVVHGRAPAGLVDDVFRGIQHGGGLDIRGLRRDFLGCAHLDHWSADPWTHGSYAALLPGQYTRFVGFVGLPERGLHFAGEHTAPLADQGYLDGAVRTGRRAAREVLRHLGLRVRKAAVG
jgi:monoamine oxidase